MASSNVDDNGNTYKENEICNSEDISVKTQEFLNSDEISIVTDPKLRREKQRVSELLESYKKLIDKLDSKFENNHVKKEYEKKLHKIPEIYAILHPELYKNPREEEKKRLINKFSKRQFSDIDRIRAPVCRTPPVNVNDVREEEKERLIKILSTCPARFHNPCDIPPTSIKKIRRQHSYSLSHDSFKNQREAEKERLSKILATSTAYYRKNLDTNYNPPSRGGSNIENTPKKNVKYLKGLPQCNGKSVIPHDSTIEIVTRDADEVGDMVRVGEYSPLSSKEKGRTLFGYGEHEERRTQLLAERRKEYKHYLTSNKKGPREKVETALPIMHNDSEEIENEQRRSRSHSISTQTDDMLVDVVDKKEIYSPPRTTQNINNEVQTSPRQVYYLSPREKLMSDLHGVSHCFPGASPNNDKSIDSHDIKLRQAAYAKALQEQIQEKRKIEEERRRKEREEDELIEHRIRMQQEKIQSEACNEMKKKQDWIAQRQSQEEILRRKMLEMKIEAQELRKQEAKKKRQSGGAAPIRELPVSVPQTTSSEPSRVRDFIKPQTTLSEPSRGRDLTGRVSMRNHPTRTNQSRWKEDDKVRMPEHRFNPIERAPLLEADRQNILSNFVSSAQTVTSLPTKANPRPVVTTAYDVESRIRDREKAEEILRAPLDFRIERPPPSPLNNGGTRLDRPTSPPIPALRTRDIINNNTKVLEQKWKIPGHGRELNRTQADHDNILTQLGAFRRQLQQEHIKLEARLQNQAST